jgi:hypothetical protein
VRLRFGGNTMRSNAAVPAAVPRASRPRRGGKMPPAQPAGCRRYNTDLSSPGATVNNHLGLCCPGGDEAGMPKAARVFLSPQIQPHPADSLSSGSATRIQNEGERSWPERLQKESMLEPNVFILWFHFHSSLIRVLLDDGEEAFPEDGKEAQWLTSEHISPFNCTGWRRHHR